MRETIGQRIAKNRRRLGWTQEQLARQVAISRVAISHIESDLSLPSERTVTLLAGSFKCSPRELVAGTTYPQAKAERLPFKVNCYTELDLQMALFERDLDWLKLLLESDDFTRHAEEVRHHWLSEFANYSRDANSAGERERITTARRALLAACDTKIRSRYSQVSPVQR